VRPGRFTVSVASEGFVSVSRMVDVRGEGTENFQLLPIPEMLRYTLTGDISATDGTCSDGVSARPCRIILFPVHNPGVIEATLAWSSTSAADLDLALFQTGVSQPIVRSATRGRHEELSASVTGGVTYELRVTWGAGSGAADYEATFNCPN
jgi:hypothetical protein